ncbi:MAG TPA: chemotaxis protein CheB [Chloroflexota bacterium]|jgi:two-component system chemotaxis response regulator CheB|nr:chemotaxis protein CheB [Chloroflexota bacterium]
MPGHDIVVVGASAGGIEALIEMVSGLPADLPAAIFVVVHQPPSAPGRLPEILSRRGALPAVTARHGLPIEHGRIYVAPPDQHLLVRAGWVELSHGPRENHMRPAVDPLFRTAARAYGPRVVGVILSGTLGDGSTGLMIVRAHGGACIVQDPDEALFGDMPRAALRQAEGASVLPVREMPPALARLTRQQVAEDGRRAMQDDAAEETPRHIEEDIAAQARDERAGHSTMFTCPDCGGVLWQIAGIGQAQFRCHVGHTYAPDTLLAQKSEVLEAALWSCVRMLREKATLTRQLATRARQAGREAAAQHIEEQAMLDERYLQVVRDTLLEGRQTPLEQAVTVAQEAQIDYTAVGSQDERAG